jgi:murein DD-endopeptidase MepM/ murein hydrolase activator NlpD
MAQARGRSRGVLAALAIIAMVVGGAVVGQSSDAAWAASYPSWTDVQNARSSESAKKAQIAKLMALLKQLEANVEATQAESERKGQEYYDAQAAFDAAAYKAELLQQQADEAQAAADESMRQAGQIAARVQRAGGQDLSVQLFFGEDSESNLLSNLGMASKVGQQSSGIYAKAKRDQNSAQSLTDEANVAKEALKGLAAAAEAAMIEAQKAADAASAALEEQAGNQERLEAQLASLVENRVVTEQQYAVGAEIRRQAEIARQKEIARLAEIERKKQEAAAGNGGGGGTSNGWTRPSYGYASSSYGPRVPPTKGASSYHYGTDFGARCGSAIVAASSGRVIYAAGNGNFGNFVKIDHGGGLTTSYAHIQGGGIRVSHGQNVSVGQVIALVGSTGISTGCHLHFEVRNYGSATNPVTFLRGKGVNI